MNKWIKTPLHELLVMRSLLLGGRCGDVQNAITHLVRNTMMNHKGDDKTIKGQKSHAMTELSDLIVQAELMTSELGYDFEKTRQLGWDRYRARKKEFEEANKGHTWI